MSTPRHQLTEESDSRFGQVDGLGSYPPGISVVIPTKGGFEFVRDLLASLLVAGKRIVEPWEVIVVDDTPAKDSAIMAEVCHVYGAKYMRGPWRVGAKRSLGAVAARFDIVLFVDSDCKASPELLLEHLLSYREHGPEVGAVVGPTEMFGDMPYVWRVAHHAREYNVPFAWPKLYREVLWGTGSNFSFRREVFTEIGGYDEETITVNGGEDVDIGIRTCESGYRIISNPRAVVFHTRDNITQFRQIATKVFRYGRADIYLCLRHPKRVVWHFNPVAALCLILAGALASVCWLGPLAFSIIPIAFLLLWARATLGRLPRRRPEAAYIGREALCVLLDWNFDAGNLFEAIRQRRPWLGFRRFYYLDPSGFIPFDQVPEAPAVTQPMVSWTAPEADSGDNPFTRTGCPEEAAPALRSASLERQETPDGGISISLSGPVEGPSRGGKHD